MANKTMANCFRYTFRESHTARWDSTLHSESEGFQIESHCCTCSEFGTQPHYEAPGRLWFVLEKVLSLISSEWGCLLPCQWPKVELIAAKFLIKIVWTSFTFRFDFFIVISDKQENISCSIGSISRSISSHDHNSTDQATAMDRY